MSIANLLADVATVPRLPDALCAGHADVFDPSTPDDDDIDTAERIAFAAKLCRRCPELQDCRNWLDSLPPTQQPGGVVAGRINGKEPQPMSDTAIPAPNARDHQRALRSLVNYAQGDLDIMPALAAEIGEDVDWFILALLSECIDMLDRRFNRAGTITYLTGRLAAASDAADAAENTDNGDVQ